VPRADFTYEIRNLPEEAFGIEDYVVRTADGGSVGTVAGLLERRGELLLAVESGLPPLAESVHVLPWREVESVDHEALAVWLRLEEDAVGRVAIELDPDRARETGSGAEARRLTDVPTEVAARPEVAPGGPVDRPPIFVAVGLVLAATFSVLVIAAAATAWETAWLALALVVPAVLAAVAFVVAIRAWRDPYLPRGEQKP
jgi:hypothetical protein